MRSDIDIKLLVAQCHDAGNIAPLVRGLCPKLPDDATQFASDNLPLNMRGPDPMTGARHETLADFIEQYSAKKTRPGFDQAAFDSVYPQFANLPGNRTLERTRAEALARGKRPKEVRAILRGRKSR